MSKKNKNIFNSTPLKAPGRSAFNLGHSIKLTGEMGQLIPFWCEPVLPGDRFKVSSSQLVRFAPLRAPIMTDVDVYVHFFFVPNRLIWSGWEKFITGADNGRKLEEKDIPAPPFLGFNADTLKNIKSSTSADNRYGYGYLHNGGLADYLGFQTYSDSEIDALPTGSAIKDSYDVDELPFRAYAKIYDDYYRDENLEDEILTDFIKDRSGLTFVNTVSDYISTDAWNLMSIQLRNWKKDYFTSALPWPQKGDDVLIPGSSLGSDLSIVGNGKSSLVGNFALLNSNGLNIQYERLAGGASVLKSYQPTAGTDVVGGLYIGDNDSNRNKITAITGKVAPNYENVDVSDIASKLSIDGGSVNSGTIRELRRAYAAQRFLERRAVGGSRYIEQNLAMFGVLSSDGRLQRAEFLGGMRQPVVISQVLQTSETTDSSPLGQPAGNAVSVGRDFIFDREFEEYGFVMGIISVMPKAEYMQGIPRKFQRKDMYDYYWPQFAHVGEQDIKNSELFFDFGSAGNDRTFGYTPRYAEYRFNNNRVCGDFKDTLSFWHMARSFNSTPGLNYTFINCDPTKRIYAYEGSDFNHLWMEIGLDCKALRPLPKYAESL